MSRTLNPWEQLLQQYEGVLQYVRQMPINLNPPGGFVDKLPQTRIGPDATEAFLYHAPSSGSLRYLTDNLDNLRAFAGAAHQFWLSTGSPPDLTPYISSGSWHHTSGAAPLIFAGGYAPAIPTPASGSRFDLLTINTSGVLSWTRGAEAAMPTPPSMPSPTSGSMPLWLILARSSGSVLHYYDQGIGGHYVFRDERPFFDWGIGGASTGSGPGAWMNNTGDVLNFAPTRVLTVGPTGAYATIGAALTAAAGLATTSTPVSIIPVPATYAEDITIGDYTSIVDFGGERGVIIAGTVTMNGARSGLRGCRVTPAGSATALVISGGTPYVFDNALVPSSGSPLQITAGTPVLKNNSYSGTAGAIYTGGTILSDSNFFNSGCLCIVDGATALIDDWMDVVQVNSGTVTFGFKASGSAYQTAGGTVTGSILGRSGTQYLLGSSSFLAGAPITTGAQTIGMRTPSTIYGAYMDFRGRDYSTNNQYGGLFFVAHSGNADANAGRIIFYQYNGSTFNARMTMNKDGTVDWAKTFSTYNNIATVGAGVPYLVASSDLTGQTAAIGATTLYAVPAAGQGLYRVSWVATITTAATTSSVLGGTIGFQVRFTDPNDSVVKTLNPTTVTAYTSAANTTSTTVSGSFIANCKASTNLQYLFGYTSVGATPMAYDLSVRVEAML